MPAAMVLALATSPGIAQIYPVRPVRIVVPGAAGGTMDLIARLVGQRISESWDQQAVVDNRPGAGGLVGTELVARAPGDGYTLLIISNGFTIRHGLGVKMQYDTSDKFAPVTLLGWTPHVLVVSTSLPAKSLKELLVLARARPGHLTYASPGVGTAPHLAGELLKIMSRIDIVHVPFQGGVPASNAIIGAHVDMMFANLAQIAPHVKAGQLRALAVATRKRVESLEQIPTMTETGVHLDSVSWFGLVAPAATPKNIVTRINAAVVRSLQAPELRAHLSAQSLHVVGNTPEQFADFIRSEIAKYARVLKATGMKID